MNLPELEKLAELAAPTIAHLFSSPWTALGLTLIREVLGIPNFSTVDTMNAIAVHPDPHQLLSDLEAKYAPLFAPLLTKKWPSSMELNIKLSWPDG